MDDGNNESALGYLFGDNLDNRNCAWGICPCQIDWGDSNRNLKNKSWGKHTRKHFVFGAKCIRGGMLMAERREAIRIHRIWFVDTSGNCQICGKYSKNLHHFGEMCDRCYREW